MAGGGGGGGGGENEKTLIEFTILANRYILSRTLAVLAKLYGLFADGDEKDGRVDSSSSHHVDGF